MIVIGLVVDFRGHQVLRYSCDNEEKFQPEELYVFIALKMKHPVLL